MVSFQNGNMSKCDCECVCVFLWDQEGFNRLQMKYFWIIYLKYTKYSFVHHKYPFGECCEDYSYNFNEDN